MKAALYVLGGIVAAFGFVGLSILSVEAAEWLFGPVWGIAAWALALITLGGGVFGWSVYRMRAGGAARDLEPRP
jgi:hypothetical protein